jgi:hypothetical protein
MEDPLTDLEGQPGSLAEGMAFNESNQPLYPSIDRYLTSTGVVAFIEDGANKVAVQHEKDGYKTFCFSYALAGLVDNDTSTRDGLMTAIMEFFGFPITGIDEPAVSSHQSSVRVYPNPTSVISSFRFQVPSSQHVTLEIFDLHGREVATVVDEWMPEGEHVVRFDAGSLPPGVYIYRKSSVVSHQLSVGKLVVVK